MIELKGIVTHDGKTYEPGEVIEKINTDQAQRLVDLGVAFFISEKTPSNDDVPPNNDNENKVDYEGELDLLEYNDLKIVAKEVGLDFKGNISKKDLIHLIINEGKADEVLKLTEVEE